MHRLYIAVPVFVIAFFLCGSEFSTAGSSLELPIRHLRQSLCGSIAAYLVSKDKSHWMASIPAAFLTVVVVDYFLTRALCIGGLHLPHFVAT